MQLNNIYHVNNLPRKAYHETIDRLEILYVEEKGLKHNEVFPLLVKAHEGTLYDLTNLIKIDDIINYVDNYYKL